MIDVIFDYRARISQIEKYLNFLVILDNLTKIENLSHLKSSKLILETNEILLGDFLSEDDSFKIDSELIRILKSNTILLLYNLVEGTISSVLNEFFGTLNKESIKYSEYKNEIRQIWIKYKHRSFATNEKKEVSYIVSTIEGVFDEIFLIEPKNIRDNELGTKIVHNYDAYVAETQSSEVSGNLDARRIRDIFSSYGLPVNTNRCDPLLKVKNKRNSLAHGNETFAQVGSNFSTQELINMKNEIKLFLDVLLTQTDSYLSNKEYKRTMEKSISSGPSMLWLGKLSKKLGIAKRT